MRGRDKDLRKVTAMGSTITKGEVLMGKIN
jgi:hypothetical protein